ncbi:MAG: fumarylacetoacetate hydrolase family protein [Gemmataceae bacterium]|nr:fumarylacetoacetate hydrolase family protein [Gemmataceae bacterium]
MQLAKVQLETGDVRVAIVADGHVRLLDLQNSGGVRNLSDLLHADQPDRLARTLVDEEAPRLALSDVTLLPPVDHQEIWSAGVTYKRSQEARERESEGAAHFYDLVYQAARPEIFFKATAARAVGSGGRVRVRRDSKWSVPEPELTLVVSPKMKIVGYTIGNDMSARDIEGENPLYLPQAKVYDQSCAVGPVVTLADAMPAPEKITIRLTIERGGSKVFEGSTSVAQMARTFADLVDWLGRDNHFPHGVLLLTGTGIVPPDDFSLAKDDRIVIEINGIGRLVNTVVSGG